MSPATSRATFEFAVLSRVVNVVLILDRRPWKCLVTHFASEENQVALSSSVGRFILFAFVINALLLMVDRAATFIVLILLRFMTFTAWARTARWAWWLGFSTVFINGFDAFNLKAIVSKWSFDVDVVPVVLLRGGYASTWALSSLPLANVRLSGHYLRWRTSLLFHWDSLLTSLILEIESFEGDGLGRGWCLISWGDPVDRWNLSDGSNHAFSLLNFHVVAWERLVSGTCTRLIRGAWWVSHLVLTIVAFRKSFPVVTVIV